MRDVVICADLDGTLFDNSHRVGLIPGIRSNTAQWEAFNCACAEDTLIRQNAEILRRLVGHYEMPEVAFFTGRGETAEAPTWSCIKDKLYIYSPYLRLLNPRLFMRSMNDYRQAAVTKRVLFERIREAFGEDKLYIVFDDDWSVICSIKEAYPQTTFIAVPSLCSAYKVGAQQK